LMPMGWVLLVPKGSSRVVKVTMGMMGPFLMVRPLKTVDREAGLVQIAPFWGVSA
jgi:hypothetical protein